MQASEMPGHVFTTLGWVPAEQVELRRWIVSDDEDTRVVRVDKYVAGKWVGNDLHVIMKRPVPLAAESATIG